MTTAFRWECRGLFFAASGRRRVRFSRVKILVPTSPQKLGGPFVTAEEGFHIIARREATAIIEFFDRPAGVDWFDEFELLFCAKQHDPETFKVIRKATDAERKEYRIPVWIQDEEVPECCGKPMQFVGQIDDDRLCGERPAGAKLWWHDAASFYVFTCAQCLACKAVGQQF